MDEPGWELTHGRRILLGLILGSALISLGVPCSVLLGGLFWAVMAVGGALMVAAAAAAIGTVTPSGRPR